MPGFETILPFLKPIEHLILDDSISEVMVNGPEQVFVEKAGFIEQVRGVSLGERSLLVAVKNIARRLGDDISETKPILDSRLPDGSRVAAVIPPCSLSGVTLTIRKFNIRHFEIADLIAERNPHSRTGEPLRRLHSAAAQPADLRRNGNGQDDATKRSWKVHSRRMNAFC